MAVLGTGCATIPLTAESLADARSECRARTFAESKQRPPRWSTVRSGALDRVDIGDVDAEHHREVGYAVCDQQYQTALNQL